MFFYVAGIIIEKYETPRPTSNLVSGFESVLHKKERELKALVDTTAKHLTDRNFVAGQNMLIFEPEMIQKMQEDGFAIFVFKDDTLRYWTDNNLKINEIYSKNEFLGKSLKWGNHIIEVEQKNVLDYTVLGIFKIKSKYEIENKYLQSEFQKDFDIDQSVEISFIFTSEAIDVKDLNGETLLFLSYSNDYYGNPSLSWLLSIVYIFMFMFLVIQFNIFTNKIYKHKKKFILVPFSLLILILIRALLLIKQVPVNIFSQDFFDSQFYASSRINSSLGDLILNIFVYFTLVVHFFKLLHQSKLSEKIKDKKILKISISLILNTFGILIFFLNVEQIKNIILNSTITFDVYNLLNFNVFSFFGFACIISITVLSAYILFSLYRYIYTFLEHKKVLLCSAISIILSTCLNRILFGQFNFIIAIFITLIVILIIIYNKNENKTRAYYYSFVGFIVAALITYVVSNALIYKQNENYKLKAFDLLRQRDYVGELLLENITEKIKGDQTLTEYAKNPSNFPNLLKNLENYMKRKYFKSYWNKYDLDVYFYSTNDSLLKNDDKNIINSKKYFKEILDNGKKLEYENAYFVNYAKLKNSYLIYSKYNFETDSVLFYFTLSPKLYPNNIGYPELLLNNKNGEIKKENFSSAVFANGNLMQSSGKYNYPLKGKNKFNKSDKFYTLKEKELRHLVYNDDENNFVVITYKGITFWNLVVLFSYLFLMFIVISVLFASYSSLNTLFRPSYWNFRTKLIASMLLVLSLTFFIVGVVIVSLSINQYNKNHKDEVITKLNQINISLSEKYSQLDSITVVWQEDKINYLDNHLRKLAEILGADVNLYSENGNIIATSRPEIFTLQLVGEQINPIAFYEINKNSVAQFAHKENISKMTYSSVYTQFMNDNNELLAIINMPYFSNPGEFKKEITNLIITIINIFVVIFVVAIVFSVLISEQIISPLYILQRKFQELEVGKKYEKIYYSRKDEIGELVGEYNKMVEKLDESIALLSKSERESAWRDMAKQIAHEIKNPLTPMKLSIQLLLRSWDNQDEDFDFRLRGVCNTLIQQIETLKRIAEEFSDFAKMPKPQEQVINITDKIEQMSKFYENTENVDVISKLNDFKDIFIIADDKQISRAFINLIKNAIQAIPDGVRGKIILDLDVYGDKVKIKVIDNGSGIPEEIHDKLFLPSFTTKSSGMGIGLAMVKNIINNAKGKISFKSVSGKGTTFILEFPLHKPE